MPPLFKLTRAFLAAASGAMLLLFFAAPPAPGTRQAVRAGAEFDVSIAQFGRYIDEWSEPEGYFDSDNFISNETSYLHVVDQLDKQVKPGGVYLGVGPDQNFSYIVHTRPALAVITDIRRQNMLEHLWYKALFALAANRVQYLSLLVARQPPPIPVDSPLDRIVDAVDAAPTTGKLFETDLASVNRLLTETYHLKLSAIDLKKIEYVYRTFWEQGLQLRFSSIGRNNALNYPTLEEMLLETDRQGRRQSYVASEESFQQLKKLEETNRLIPIVGDFAGSHALKTVGAFLKAQRAPVSVFYTSNVEFYLFGSPADASWERFVANVHALPVTDDAVFIRAYFGNGPRHPLNIPGHRSTSLLKPVRLFLADYDAGRIRTYWDIVKP